MSGRASFSALSAICVITVASGLVLAAENGLVASLYDNADFTSRKVVRVDPVVNFNWGTGSPAPEIGADTFSIRWEGQVEALETGTYTFTTLSDDGVRLWVNGTQVINNWTNHGATENSGTIALEAGHRYDIKLEYYENTGNTAIALKYQAPSQTSKVVIPAERLYPPAWYVNPPEVVSRVPAAGGGIDAQAPGVTVTFSKPMDQASVEAAFGMSGLSGSFSWSADTLTFKPVAPLSPNASYTVTIDAGAQAFDGTALAAPYSFTVSTGTYNGFLAQYFDTMGLTACKLSRLDQKIDFNWGSGSPASVIAPDTFSARWTGYIQPKYDEVYTFSIYVDNGVRLWIGGQLLIDDWRDVSPREVTATTSVALVAGQKYPIKLEFFENYGGAQVKLSWQSASQIKEIVPAPSIFVPDNAPLPSAPSNVVFTHIADRTVVLAWQAPTDDSPVGRFEIYRNGAYVASTTSTEYRDTYLTPNTAYAYKVRSVSPVGGMSAFSATATATTLPSAFVGTGSGLLAKIYDNPDFTTRKLVRVDPKLDWNWGSGAPATGVSADTYSIRWQGQIQPQYSEQYTIYTVSDDGVRVWINGQAVIDNWTDHSAKEDKGVITLQAGQKYDIRVDYYENGGDAVAKLLWESLSQPKELIATTQLYPAEFLASLDVKLLTDTESPVNPAWVEWDCSEDAAALRFSVNGGAEQDAVRENAERCYGDTASAQGLPYGIPLDQVNPTEVKITADDGAGQTKTTAHSLIWKPTKLNDKSWSEDEMVIRVNDSLLFTVESNDPALLVALDADEDGTVDYFGPAGMKFPFKYTVARQYTVTAWLGGDECGTLTVTVVDADLKGPIACEIGYQREKFVAPVAPTGSVSFIANNPGLLGVSVKGSAVESGVQGQKLYLKTLGRGTPVLQARLNGTSGPLIKQQEVDEFTLDTQATKFIGVIETFEDGSMLVQTSLELSPKVENLNVTLNIFVSGVTFEDSTLVKTLNTSSFTLDPESGKYLYPYQMIVTPGIKTGTCHTIKITQGSEQVGL